MAGNYKATKKWKKKNPEENAAHKKKNYASTAFDNINYKRRWCGEEDTLILNSPLTDRELHHQMGRSVQGIQVRRSRLKSGSFGLS